MLTPIVLLVGGVLLPFLGWLVGIVLLWASHAWTLRDKLIGTLVIPGGLMVPVYLLTVDRSAPSKVCGTTTTTADGTTLTTFCTHSLFSRDPQFTVLIVLAFIAPVLTTVYLIRRARTAPP